MGLDMLRARVRILQANIDGVLKEIDRIQKDEPEDRLIMGSEPGRRDWFVYSSPVTESQAKKRLKELQEASSRQYRIVRIVEE